MTMIGPCLTQLYFQTNLSLETLNTETKRSKGHVEGVLSSWVHERAVFGYESASRALPGLYFNHILAMFRSAGALNVSRLK